MPSLADNKTATSGGVMVGGVNLKGTSARNTGNVSIRNTTAGTHANQAVHQETDVNVTQLDKGEYSITNNSGGTITYKWL